VPSPRDFLTKADPRVGFFFSPNVGPPLVGAPPLEIPSMKRGRLASGEPGVCRPHPTPTRIR
jgi:hypothetical protein